jgi:hypothetical protein
MSVQRFVCDYHKTRSAWPHQTCTCGVIIAASGMSAGTAETQSGSGLQPASPTSQSEGTPNPKGNPGPPGVRS